MNRTIRFDDEWHRAKRESARRSRARKRGEPVPIRSTGHAPVALSDRLWARVAVGSADECWPWTGAVQRRSGHGTISVGGRGSGMEGTHRVAYRLTKGSIDGLQIRHTCDNPPCCNPAHLIAGTHADNMRDMAIRERGWKTKLTATQVLEIRRRSSEPHADLANEFGVSKSNISMIITRQTWKHVHAESFALLLEGGPDVRPVIVLDPTKRNAA